MAGLVSCFSSSTNIAFLVMTAFSFITVAEGRCFYCNIGQVCCKNKCVDGSSCVGYPCFDNQDCSSDESCCFPFGKYSKQCVSGSSCLGQGCILTSADCSFNQTCCNSKCVQGKSCIGKYCVTKYTDCAPGEWCYNRECRSSCLGQSCIGDSDCSFNQTCCEYQCVQGKIVWANTALPTTDVLTVNHAVIANAKEVLAASVNPVPPITIAGRLKENNAVKASVQNVTVLTQSNTLHRQLA